MSDQKVPPASGVNSASIGICMATYNGGAFLPQQLASISAQTCSDWHLYVRDDGSDDGTPQLLHDFSARHPGQVTILSDRCGRLGVKGNFARLMATACEPYVAFSDQDDVWHPDKLFNALCRMKQLEATVPAQSPAMVHADRRVIDADGKVIAPSYWKSRGIGPSNFGRLEQHYAFCFAAGSTMLINRPLLALALPVPDGARMYDCWIELVAHAFGAVAAIDQTVLDHRRHGSNASGADCDIDSPAARRFDIRARRFARNVAGQRQINQNYFSQARCFRSQFGTALSACKRRKLDLFLSLPERSLPRRVFAMSRSGTMPPGLLRGIAFLATTPTSAG